MPDDSETAGPHGLSAAARASQERALATVRRTMATVRRVIDANEKLANHPDHQASAQQRIIEGNAELAQLAVEETKLVEAIRDDVIAAPTGDTGDAGFRSVGAQLGGNPDIAEPEPRAGSETEPHDQG